MRKLVLSLGLFDFDRVKGGIIEELSYTSWETGEELVRRRSYLSPFGQG